MVAAMATMVLASGPAPEMAEVARVAAESVEGWLREYPGYRGVIVLTDEDGARSKVITFWDTSEDEARARESRAAMRDSVGATVGMRVERSEVFEVPVLALVGE